MSWPRAILSLVTFLFCVFPITAAKAERRVALVIGNSAYEKAPRLRNPENDSQLIAESLRKLGFAVTEGRDLTQKEMRRAVAAFTTAVRNSRDDTVALFFYAGHGLQVQGVNYLVPVDASIASESDVVVEAVRLNDVLEAINEAQPRTTVVILDACRDNPFGRGFRSMTRGLAEVRAGPGSLIAYSTAPGDVAADGDGRNSPYSAALASAMAKPGLDIEHVFKSVRISVYESTSGRQTPWESSSLTRDFRFAAIDRSDASPAPTPQSTTAPKADPNGSAEAEAERAYWEAVALNTPEAYEVLLQRFPNHRRRDAVDKLLTRAYDQRMWDTVRKQDTILGYEQYKIAFPDGIYTEDATRRIADLRQPTIGGRAPQPDRQPGRPDRSKPEQGSTVRGPEPAEEAPSESIAKRPSYWDHNDSLVYLEADGSTRRFYYERPRPGMRGVGAQRGSLLFEGVRSQASYSGTAYIFAGKCGKFPYRVSGRVLNEHKILMTGRAPKVDRETCRILGYKDDDLLFTHRSSD